ncbi:cysteine hydrolase family protein [Vibrio sp. HN007]|uniref:cysteine hydrolase family protein n=1 Tax=Vibrio iocasae TaxID=3098914 RepID=UPI0035D4F75C
MKEHALILVDIQNDYFPGGKWPLHNMEASAENAKRILELARAENIPVIHVYHESIDAEPAFFAPSSEGTRIHSIVAPIAGELIVCKNEINSFLNTNLEKHLKELSVKHVTILGSMSHMCIDAAARATHDLGYTVTIVEDACATRDLEFKGRTVAAEDVHSAFMSALDFAYAEVVSTQDYLNNRLHKGDK